MRTRITDPVGPWLGRWATALFGLATLGTGLLLARELGGAIAAIFGLAIFFAGPLFTRHFRPRDATLELLPGAVRVRGAGILSQSIRARDVTSASTARTADGYSLALDRRGRKGRPVVLELASQDEVKAVRDALGIGHFGFGVLSWPTRPGRGETLAVLSRALGAFLALSLLFRPQAGVEGLAAVGIFAAFVGLAIAFVMGIDNLAVVSLRNQGLWISGVRDPRFYLGQTPIIPYHQIVDAQLAPDGLFVYLTGSPEPLYVKVSRSIFGAGMTLQEREHVVAQLVSASRRARGEGAPPPGVNERVADLAQGAEPARSWLERLDATAQLVANGAGYRGAGFDEADLWTTLEDHDADADVRAGAARVLLRVDAKTSGERVESILAAVRDEKAEKRIRIAIEPNIDEAAEVLDTLERVQRMPVPR